MASSYRIKMKGCEQLGYRFIPQFKFKYIPYWFSWSTTYTGFDHSTLAYETLEQAQQRIRDVIKNKADRKMIITSYIPFIK